MTSLKEQRAEKFYELKSNGIEVEEIASTYLVSSSYVSSLIKYYERKSMPVVPKIKVDMQMAQEFRALKISGATIEEIAEKYGVSYGSVSQGIKRYERKYNLSESSKNASDLRAEEFRALRLKGTTLEDIAGIYGLSRQRVDQVIKRYEQRWNLPSSMEASKDLVLSAKKADIEEYKEVQRLEKQLQYKRFASTFSLDAHLVGRFLSALGNNAVLYCFAGKSQSNPRKRKDGTPYPCQSTPTHLMMYIGAPGEKRRGRGRMTMHAWVLEQYEMRVGQDENCHHVDGDITNNMLENLQILTRKEHGRLTMQEQMEKGTMDYKSNPHFAPALSNEQVEEIRVRYKTETITVATLAEKYGVGSTVIAKALYGEGVYVNVNPATRCVKKTRISKKRESDTKQTFFDFALETP